MPEQNHYVKTIDRLQWQLRAGRPWEDVQAEAVSLIDDAIRSINRQFYWWLFKSVLLTFGSIALLWGGIIRESVPIAAVGLIASLGTMWWLTKQ